MPGAEQGVVPREKIVGYLLSPIHPAGRGKAAFFARCGFTVAAWRALATALLRHAQEHAVVKVESTPFGSKFVIEGSLETPSGSAPSIRAVWFVNRGEETPRFVTAYPLE